MKANSLLNGKNIKLHNEMVLQENTDPRGRESRAQCVVKLQKHEAVGRGSSESQTPLSLDAITTLRVWSPSPNTAQRWLERDSTRRSPQRGPAAAWGVGPKWPTGLYTVDDPTEAMRVQRQGWALQKTLGKGHCKCRQSEAGWKGISHSESLERPRHSEPSTVTFFFNPQLFLLVGG